MQVKKSPKANLEKRKFLFTEIGLVLALALCLWAFEMTSEELGTSSLGDLSANDLMEEEIDVTSRDEQQPEPETPEPEVQEEQIIEELVVVDDDVKVDDIRINTEADDKTKTNTNIVPASDFKIEDDEYIEPVAFAIVEDKPMFPGGEAALMGFIRQNTTYPPTAKELGVQGRVFVQFVIDVNGKVTQVKIAQGVDQYLDTEALRVVNLLPNWTPGKQRGKKVPVTYIVPINFKLS